MNSIDIPLNMTQLVIVAFFVESLIQTIKPIYDKEKGWNSDALLALGIGILVCLLTSTDIFDQVGLPLLVPYVGSVLTGIMASRGSNIAHDLFKWVQSLSGTGINTSGSSSSGGITPVG
jgi:hypothetical protein